MCMKTFCKQSKFCKLKYFTLKYRKHYTKSDFFVKLHNHMTVCFRNSGLGLPIVKILGVTMVSMSFVPTGGLPCTTSNLKRYCNTFHFLIDVDVFLKKMLVLVAVKYGFKGGVSNP